MVVKVKEFFEKTRHVKNNDKSKNMFYVEKKIQDIMNEFYLKKEVLKEQFHFHLFELEHLIELEHLPQHLIEELFGARTLT